MTAAAPRFAGKVAVVTGGGGGIGRATALRFAGEGAAVVVADIAAESAEAVAEEIRSQGGRALVLATDVSDPAAVEEMVERTVGELGRIDVLFNNAALVAPAWLARDGEIVDFELEVFDRSMAVNVLGPLLACKYAIPRMLEQGGGSIVNTASVSGLGGYPTIPIYGMTKAAVIILTQNVATQYGKRGIRCNAVAPGGILTPPYLASVPPERREASLEYLLTPRLGEPEDVAAAVAFLASDEAEFIQAQTLSIDGGRLSWWR